MSFRTWDCGLICGYCGETGGKTHQKPVKLLEKCHKTSVKTIHKLEINCVLKAYLSTRSKNIKTKYDLSLKQLTPKKDNFL